MRFKNFIPVFSLLIIALLTSCVDDTPTSNTSKNTPDIAKIFLSKGPVSDATCSIYSLNYLGRKDTLLATEKSTGGNLSFNNTNYQGNAIIECKGGTFTDEATGINNTPAPDMNAIVIFSSTGSFSVTPLTELAYRLAINDGNLETAISKHNSNIAKQFGLEQTDITTVKPTNLNTQPAQNNQAGSYGTVLASLSQLVVDASEQSGSGSALEKTLNALAQDLITTGKLDSLTKTNLSNATNNLINNSTSIAASNINTQISQQIIDIIKPATEAPTLPTSINKTWGYGQLVNTISFINTGGKQISSCSVSPNLPTGLRIQINSNLLTCELLGTALQTTPRQSFNLVMKNAIGSANIDFNLEIVKVSSFTNIGSDTVKTFGDDNFIQSVTANSGTGRFAYQSSNTAVATVSPIGEVTILDVGNTIITVTQAGNANYISSSDNYTLTVQKASNPINFSSNVSKNLGNAPYTQQASSSSVGQIRYRSSNESIATVNSITGEVTLLALGTTNIIANQTESANYLSGSDFYTLTVQPALTEEQKLKDNMATSGLDTTVSLYNIIDNNVFKGFLFEQTILGKPMSVVAVPVSATDFMLFAKPKSNDAFTTLVEIANNTLADNNLNLDDLGFIGDKVFTWVSTATQVNENQLPSEAVAILSSIYGNTFTLDLKPGLALHTKQNVDLMPEMKAGLDFINMASNRISTVQIPLLNPTQNIRKKAFIDNINYSFNLPSFTLQFGLYMHLAIQIQPMVTVHKSADSFNLTFKDTVDVPFDKWVIPMDFNMLYATKAMALGEKRISFKFTNNANWNAFGADWLTMNDFSIAIKEIPEKPLVDAIIMPPLLLQITGTSNIAGKGLTLRNEVIFAPLVGATPNVVIPGPSKIGFVIHDGYGKIGGVSLKEVVTILDYMFTSVGINAGLITNQPFPDMKVVGVLPSGQTIQEYEYENNHPVGPKFDLFFGQLNGKPEGFNLAGAVTLFDEPILTTDIYQVSTRYGIQKHAYTPDAYRVADLFDFPTFNLDVSIPGVQDLIDIAATDEVNASTTGIGSAVSQMATLIESISVKMSGVSNILGTQGTQIVYEIKGLTRKAEVDLIFGGLTAQAAISASAYPWDPSYKFNMLFDSNQLTASHVNALEGLVSTGFSQVNTGIANVNDAVDQAQADLTTAQNYLTNTINSATARKNKVEKPIRDARAYLKTKRNNLSSYDYNAYYKYSSKRICVDTLLGSVCSPSERSLHYLQWKAGRSIYTSAIWIAEQALTGVLKSIDIIPVDAYPEVISAKALVLAAELNLASAETTATALQAVSNAVQVSINTIIDLAGKFSENVFALTNFELYGGLGLNNRLGVDVTAIILGETYQFDFDINDDITYLRDNFATWIVDNVWPTISNIIVGNTISSAATTEFANIGSIINAPTGAIPAQTILQNNTKDCATLGASCYTLDIASYISDIDTGDVLEFHAIGLPKGLNMDITGTISGIVTRNDVGVHKVKVWVTDKTFARLDVAFDLTVQAVNSPHSIQFATQYTDIKLATLATDEQANVALLSNFAQIKGNAKSSEFTELAKVIVTDPDLEDSYTYEIIAGNESGHFAINNQGIISLTQLADNNILNGYNLTIKVTDKSTNAPAALVAQSDFSVDIKPVVWIEQTEQFANQEYQSGDLVNMRQFAIKIAPEPSGVNDSHYTVNYKVTALPLATDDFAGAMVEDYDSKVLQRHLTGYGTGVNGANSYAWGTKFISNMQFAQQFNKQLDRRFKVELISVEGGAYLNDTNTTLEAIAYAPTDRRAPKLTKTLNDTGIQTWADLNNNNLTLAQPQIPKQDADTGLDAIAKPLGKQGFSYTKLAIDGTPLADTATDWACVKDNNTGYMWASRQRIKDHIAQSAWPIGWSNTDVSSYGLNLMHASFGSHIDNVYLAGINYNWDTYGAYLGTPKNRTSYCGSQDVNIPTVTELQGLIDYAKQTGLMVNNQFFPNIQTSNYLAVNVDRFNTTSAILSDWIRDNRADINNNLNTSNGITTVTGQWESTYLQGLADNYINGFINLPVADTPIDEATTINNLETSLSKLLTSVSFVDASIKPANTNYVFNTLVNQTTPSKSRSNLLPYYNGDIMYVIYPKSNANTAQFQPTIDGTKDEDLSQFIFQNFRASTFQVLN